MILKLTHQTPVYRPVDSCALKCPVELLHLCLVVKRIQRAKYITGLVFAKDLYNFGLIRVTKVDSGANHELTVLQGVYCKVFLCRYFLNIFLEFCEVSFLSSYGFRQMCKLL